MGSEGAAVAVRPRARPVAVTTIENRGQWNDLVCSLPGYELEQAYEWAEVLGRSGARPYRYAVLADGRCIAAVSLLRWQFGRLGPVVLDAPRGPMVALDDEQAWAGVTAAITQSASTTRAAFVRISPPVPDVPGDTHAWLLRQGFVALPEQWTLWNVPKIVMTLPLIGSETDVWNRISARRRREIRLAENTGISIDGGGEADLEEFFALLLAMGRSKRYPIRRQRHFQALHHEYQAAGTEAFLIARWRGRVIGALQGARFGARAYLLYSTVDREAATAPPAARAGPLLYWRFIRWAKREGCDVVHWGGSGTSMPPHESDPGYGVYQFKRSFGSTCWAYLGYYDLIFRPALYRVLRAAERRWGPLAWKLRAWLNR